MNLLYKYLNGNVEVSIYDNGTKIQEWPDGEVPSPIYPNSFDLKITNYCDLGCKFCHEMSTVKGEHGDLVLMSKLVEELPSGTEIAIGGGNPLDHPDLITFLERCKELGLICNLTINFNHLEKFYYTINKLLNENLIYGLGISVNYTFNQKLVESLDKTENIVYHVIAGVDPISILNKIKDSKVAKVLVLGYKDVGRGINFHDEDVDELKKEWYEKLPNFIGKVHLSFDNLAIGQLNIRRFFDENSWKQFYCGNDGEFTFYIDLPNKKYAMSSTSPYKSDLSSSISEMFKDVRSKRS